MCLTKILNFYLLKLPILRKPFVLAMPYKKLRYNGIKCILNVGTRLPALSIDYHVLKRLNIESITRPIIDDL